MASYIIHHIAAEQFLSKLEQKYLISFNENEKNSFFVGNLIVDSSKLKNPSSKDYQTEKKVTHFRNDENSNLCIKIPNIEMFLEKYSKYIVFDSSIFGYFFHLYTDKIFFEDLFNMTFTSLNSNMKETIYTNETKYILIKKNNKVVPYEEFWSNGNPKVYSIYNDYTLMNKILIQNYGLETDLDKLLLFGMNLSNDYIEEVDYKNIKKVLNDMKQYIDKSNRIENMILNVFKYEDINNFIDYVCSNAINYIEANKKYFIK